MNRWIGLVAGAVYVAAGAGCDNVFKLGHVDDPVPGDGLSSCTPVGHDEDNDGLDDACDPCPYADDNVVDPDGDGITGICDPEPMVKNQRILFAGMDTAGAPMFSPNNGSFMSDAFHSVASVPSATLMWPMTIDHVWVTAGFDVVSLGAGDQYHEVGLIFDATLSSTDQLDGIYCVLGLNNGDPYTEVYTSQDGTELTQNSAHPTLDLTTVGPATVRGAFTRGADPEIACTFSGGGSSTAITGSRTETQTPGAIALFTESAEAAFQFLFVVTRS